MGEEQAEEVFWRVLGKEPSELDSFLEYLKSNDHTHTCTASYNSPTLIASCKDCELNFGCDSIISCICIPCFLNGNHEGHRVTFRVSSSATCDCGDLSSWKEEGMCSIHKREKNEKKALTIPEEEVEKIRSAISQSIMGVIAPFSLLKKLLDVGDCIGSIVKECILERFDFDEFFKTFNERDTDEVVDTLDLFSCSRCVTGIRSAISQAFIRNFATIFDQVYEGTDIINFYPNLKAWQKLLPFYFYPTLLKEEPLFSDPEQTDELIKFIGMLFEKMGMLLNHPWVSVGKMYSLTCIHFVITVVFEAVSISDVVKPRMPEILEMLFNFISSFEFSLSFPKKLAGFDDDEDKVGFSNLFIQRAIQSIMKNLFDKNLIDGSVLPIYAKFMQEKYPIEEEEKYGYILDGETLIPGSILLHSAVGMFLSAHKKDCKEIVQGFCEENSLDFNRFCRHFTAPILKVLVAIPYVHFRMFAGTSKTSLFCVMHIVTDNETQRMFIPFFTAAQMMFGITDDKDGFIKMLGEICGIYSDLDENDTKAANNIFFFYLCSFLFNSNIAENDLTDMKRTSYSIAIKLNKKCRWNELLKVWYNPDFDQDIFTYAKKETTAIGSYFRLTSNRYLKIFSPWISIRTILELISVLSDEEIPENPIAEIEGIDMKPVLESQVLIDAIVNALNIKSQSINTFVVQIIKAMESVPKEIIDAVNQNDVKSAINYLKSINEIEIKEEKEEICIHEESEKLHKSILKNLSNKSDDFDFEESESDDKEEKSCSICHENGKKERLYFPLITIETEIASEVDFKLCGGLNEPKTANEMILCEHMVHKGCVNLSEFFCPVCSQLRNKLLPNLVEDTFTDIEKTQEILNFLQSVYSSPLYLPKLLRTLCGHIMVLEVRFRSNQHCFDRYYHSCLIKNLFIILRFLLDQESKEIGELKFDIFEQSTINLALDKEIIDNERLSHCTVLQKAVFLRRMKILKMLLEGDHSIDEWSRELEVSHLFAENKLNYLPVELKKYSFNVPHYYHDLFRRPKLKESYKFDRCDLVVLHNGDVIQINNIFDFRTLYEYSKNKLHNSPAFFLFVNGKKATSILIVSGSFPYPCFINPFYVDEQGDSNVGLNRPTMLTLSESIYQETTDLYLSSEWTANYQEL